MKPQYFVTIIMATALYQPTALMAQHPHGSMQRPHSGAAQLGSPDRFLPGRHAPLPNRRVPSVTPPHINDGHPITPEEAWPESPTAPDRPFIARDKDERADNALFDEDRPTLDETEP